MPGFSANQCLARLRDRSTRPAVMWWLIVSMGLLLPMSVRLHQATHEHCPCDAHAAASFDVDSRPAVVHEHGDGCVGGDRLFTLAEEGHAAPASPAHDGPDDPLPVQDECPTCVQLGLHAKHLVTPVIDRPIVTAAALCDIVVCRDAAPRPNQAWPGVHVRGPPAQA